jgi:hypothetical protein
MDLKQYADELEVGQTTRVNHEDCSAGEDTRRRLYLTRPHSDPTKVLCYCHNCGVGWATKGNKYTKYRDERDKKHAAVSSTITVSDDVHEPAGLITDYELWPTKAKGWAIKNKLTAGLIRTYGIAHDPSTNRVYLPRHRIVRKNQSNGVIHNLGLCGYQLRNVDGTRGPKYLTASHPIHDDGFTCLTNCASDARAKVSVIVEDLVSGIHVFEALAQSHPEFLVRVLVNYGIKINLLGLDYIKNTIKCVVWLDNDSSYVKKQAEQMGRTMQMVINNGTVVTVLDKEDPKHFSWGVIKEEIVRG